MSKNILISFTRSELNHISYLLEMNHRDGVYWGNYDQYQRRAEKIRNKIKKRKDGDRINMVSGKDDWV